MPTLHLLRPDGSRRTLEVPEGTSVMQAAINAGVPEILGECGGNCMCATCHCYVEGAGDAALPPMSEDEDALLDGTAADRLPASRLGCQVKLTPALDGLTVRLPERQV